MLIYKLMYVIVKKKQKKKHIKFDEELLIYIYICIYG